MTRSRNRRPHVQVSPGAPFRARSGGRAATAKAAPIEPLILRYGLIAIFLGTGIEGEPFALAGGMLAERGLLAPWAVLAVTFAGAIGIDQGWFWMARRARSNRWIRSVSQRPAFARALDLLERHPTWFLLLFRFAYGLRSVAPVVIGLSRIRYRLFLTLNLVAAAIWSGIFTALGYLAGPLFEQLSKRFGSAIEIGAVLLSITVLAYSLRKGSSGRPPA